MEGLTTKENLIRKKLRSYIKVLRAVRNDIESEQDKALEQAPPTSISMNMTAKDSEIITLGVVIRDLTDMAYDPEFSYWDKKDC